MALANLFESVTQPKLEKDIEDILDKIDMWAYNFVIAYIA